MPKNPVWLLPKFCLEVPRNTPYQLSRLKSIFFIVKGAAVNLKDCDEASRYIMEQSKPLATYNVQDSDGDLTKDYGAAQSELTKLSRELVCRIFLEFSLILYFIIFIVLSKFLYFKLFIFFIFIFIYILFLFFVYRFFILFYFFIF